MRFVGLYREAECSPGPHRTNDAQLLDLVAEKLRLHGCQVDLTTLVTQRPTRAPEGLIFSMCQGRVALDLLLRWESDGARIVNPPKAALKTYREHLPGLLRSAGIPFPETRLINTSKGADEGVHINGGVWLKRGDMHPCVGADVQWIDTADRLRASLKEFAGRGITRAALQTHVSGNEVKFYGVTGGRLFHWYYPSDPDDHRHGFDVAELERLATSAATAAGLAIYGGDVMVGPSGALTLIDLNAWPSFAPCRNQAADAIAGYLMGHLNVAWHRGLVSIANNSVL
jgi:hypothetical protein